MKQSTLLTILLMSMAWSAIGQGKTYTKSIDSRETISGVVCDLASTFQYRLQDAGYGDSPTAFKMGFTNSQITEITYKGYKASAILDDVSFPVKVRMQADVNGQISLIRGRISIYTDFRLGWVSDGGLDNFDFSRSFVQEIFSSFGEDVKCNDITAKVSSLTLSGFAIGKVIDLRNAMDKKIRDIKNDEAKEIADSKKKDQNPPSESNSSRGTDDDAHSYSQQNQNTTHSNYATQNYNNSATSSYSTQASSSSSNESASSNNNQYSPDRHIPTPEEIFANARAEQEKQDAIADQFAQDMVDVINADGSVNSAQAGLAVTRAVTQSTGNAQTGAIAGAVTTGVSLIAQGIAAKRARKEEEARLEMERLNREAIEGIGTYSDGEKDGFWWYGYGHEDLKAQGNYLNGIQHGRWIYRKQGEDDLLLSWFDNGDRIKSLVVNWNYDPSYDFYETSDGKMWLTAKSFYTRKGYRSSLMMEGEYVDGKRDGEFLFKYDDGSGAQIVNYIDNVAQGSISGWRPGTTVNRDLRIFDGEMKEGLKSGYWNLYEGNINKLSSEGAFDADRRLGVWKFYHRSGYLTSAVNFEDDAKNGEAVIFYPDGEIAGIRQYNNGIPDGNWASYYNNKAAAKSTTGKKKKSVGHYALRVLVPHVLIADAAKKGEHKKKAKKNTGTVTTVGALGSDEEQMESTNERPTIIDESLLMATVAFKDGQLNGPYTKFHGNGSLMEQGSFVAGMPMGIWKYYDDEENLIAEGPYASGLVVEEDFFYNVKSKDLIDDWGEPFRYNGMTGALPIQEDIYKYRYDTDLDIANLTEGVRTGTWKVYYASGQVKEIINYDETGQKHGSFESFYDNGNPKAIGEYYLNKKVGDWQNFKANGDEKGGLMGKKEGKKKAALELFKKKK